MAKRRFSGRRQENQGRGNLVRLKKMGLRAEPVGCRIYYRKFAFVCSFSYLHKNKGLPVKAARWKQSFENALRNDMNVSHARAGRRRDVSIFHRHEQTKVRQIDL